MPETPPVRRQWDTGRIRPKRPCPKDFREKFIELGWDEVEWHYRTNWRVIGRWVDECGRDELRAARAEMVKKVGLKFLHMEPVVGRRDRKSAKIPAL